MFFVERETFHPLEKKPYVLDGRKTVEELDASFSRLETKYNWKKVYLYTQTSPSVNTAPDIFLYLSPSCGPAIWYFGGIHGEESAPPNAYAENVDLLGNLGKNIPIVLAPVLNKLGYCINQRYPSTSEDQGSSISDADFLLPGSIDPQETRRPFPSSHQTFLLFQKIIDLLPYYPPLLVYDGHEDFVEESKPIMEDNHLNPNCYIYSQGRLGPNDPIAVKIVQIFKKHGFTLIKEGKTRFPHEIVENGIVYRDDGQIIKDGSLEEFFACDTYFYNNSRVKKVPAPHIITGETTINGYPLPRRIAAHSEVIQCTDRFWKIASQGKNETLYP